MKTFSCSGVLRAGVLRAGVLSLALAGAAAPAALAQTAPTTSADSFFHATTLNLTADGEVKVTPDMATISMGVQTDAPTAAQALAANAEQMGRVVASLKRAGLADRDIRTSQLNVSPQYVYEQNKPPRLTGYQATNQVTIVARDLKKLGQTVDAAVNAGANTVGGISFGLQDPQAAEDAARRDAVRALEAKADLYAKATGYRIARLVSLSEGTSYSPPPMPIPMAAASFRAKAETAVEPGETQVRIVISGVFELTR